ncbi:hypothetical protein OE88DRAFT_1640800 [Heliocybe sulcata]|uniref:Uncharacterized protein n=1 Tax=Heliocybe sulcata TaxID=5364 RepID=A0A5C3NHY1_9AGAM|nr:hypothetical protein OE88DRAFT_1640800 [Heliocybe sulcata]
MSSSLESMLLYGPVEPDINANFFNRLSIEIIFTISKLSRSLYSRVESYKAKTWNIGAFLHKWFPDPTAFRRVLCDAGAVIAGSQALQFFNRECYHAVPMDIYLPPGSVIPVGTYLCSIGYVHWHKSYHTRYQTFIETAVTMTARKVLRGNEIRESKNNLDLIRTLTFRCQIGSTFKEIVLRVVHPYQVLRHILHASHSTCVMNFIAFDRAVSVFPNATMIHRTTFMNQDKWYRSYKGMDWQEKYKRRGFKIAGCNEGVRSTSIIPIGIWSTEDSACWAVHFPLLQEEPVDPTEFRVASDHRLQFEVLDWSSNLTRPTAYVRIADPFVISAFTVPFTTRVHGCRQVNLIDRHTDSVLPIALSPGVVCSAEGI